VAAAGRNFHFFLRAFGVCRKFIAHYFPTNLPFFRPAAAAGRWKHRAATVLDYVVAGLGKSRAAADAGRNIKEFDISPWFGRDHVARSSSGLNPLRRRAPGNSVQWTPARVLYTQTCIDTHDDIQHGFNENNLCMSRPAFISFE